MTKVTSRASVHTHHVPHEALAQIDPVTTTSTDRASPMPTQIEETSSKRWSRECR